MYTSVYVPEVENKNPKWFLVPQYCGRFWLKGDLCVPAGWRGAHVSTGAGYLSQGKYISHQNDLVGGIVNLHL